MLLENSKTLENKDRRLYILLLLLLVFTFVISQRLRMGIFGDNLGSLNFICIFIISLIFVENYQHINKKNIYIYFFVNIYCISIQFISQQNIEKIVMTCVSFTIPLILCTVKIEKEMFFIYLKKFIKLMNFLIFMITVIGIFDFITHGKVMLVICKVLGSDLQNQVQSQQNNEFTRMYSFMGHPLVNTELYLIYYSVNMIYNSYFKPILNSKIVAIMSIIGISLTMSKTGFILLIILIFFINSKKLNIKYLLFVSAILFISFEMGVFNNVIARFTSGSLTSGRSEAWEVYKNLGVYPMKFFTGYGLSSSYSLNNFSDWLVAAFEYPIRMFAFEQGILMTILIYFFIGIYPILELLKKKHFKILFTYLIVFVDINTFNGLSLPGDYMLIFCIFIFVIVNISNYTYKNK